MIYLSHVGYTYAAKNQLQTAVQTFIVSKNREVTEANRIGNYMNEIINNIEELNKRFPRCTPLQAHFWQPEEINKHPDHHLTIQEANRIGQTITLISFSL